MAIRPCFTFHVVFLVCLGLLIQGGHTCEGPLACGWTIDETSPVGWFQDKDTGSLRTVQCRAGRCGLARLLSIPFRAGARGISSFRFRWQMRGDSRVYLRVLIRHADTDGDASSGQEIKLWEQWANWGEVYQGRFRQQDVKLPTSSKDIDVQLVLEANILFGRAYVALRDVSIKKVQTISTGSSINVNKTSLSATSTTEGSTDSKDSYEESPAHQENEDDIITGKDVMNDFDSQPDASVITNEEDLEEDIDVDLNNNGYTGVIVPRLCLSQDGD